MPWRKILSNCRISWVSTCITDLLSSAASVNTIQPIAGKRLRGEYIYVVIW